MAISKEHFEHLIGRSTDIVVATDRKGTVVYYNDGAKRSLGYEADEVLGRFVAKLYPSVAEAKRVMSAMRSPDHGGPGIVGNFQTTFVSNSGDHIPVAISGTILFDDHGEEDGTIGFAKDLRDILHKDQLATLGEVAVGLSHEINNPLAVILNEAELLEGDIERMAGDRETAVECERLDAMRREVQRIHDILARLSDMVTEEIYETVSYVGPARMVDLSDKSLKKRARDPRLEGLRILVADDDLGICRTLSELLEHDGCEVELANDGEEALWRLERAHFDVVLADVVMPKMDGYELYTQIRRRYPGLPVLLMTAFHYDKDHILKRSRLIGLDAVIFKKPIDPDRLRQVIIESMSNSQSGAPD